MLLAAGAPAGATPLRGRLSLELGPSFGLRPTGVAAVLGLQGALAVTPNQRGSLVLALQLNLSGDVTSVRLPLGFEYVFPVGPRGLSLYARLSLGYAARVIDLGPARSITLHSGLLLPEAGIRYLIRDRVHVGLDAIGFPILFDSGGVDAEYRFLAYASVDLPWGKPPVYEIDDPQNQNRPRPARVDIDVDTNRNGRVEDDADEPGEADEVDFLSSRGALVLVNCDSDLGGDARDLDDTVITSDEDARDLSPVSLDLKDDLKEGEELWLVAENADPADAQELWINFFDRASDNAQDQTLLDRKHRHAVRLDGLRVSDQETLFPDRRRHRYDGRFLLEGLRFAKQVKVRLEIRKAGVAVASDEVRVLDCPWLVNNNTQPLVDPAALGIPGNLTNSRSYAFTGEHGVKVARMGADQEFVQDSVEWGFQVRRQTEGVARAMVVGLRLYSSSEDRHPRAHFLTREVGIYGYWNDDEQYFEQADGDQGGNLDALPPSEHSPFGRLIHGAGMSARLENFLRRQRAQVVEPPVVLDPPSLGLAHVDELMVVVPTGGAGYFVAMPDWDAGVAIISAAANARKKPVGIDVVIDDRLLYDPTYADLARKLRARGAEHDRGVRLSAALSGFRRLVADAGATVVPMPQLYFQISTLERTFILRSFPRGIANSQPTLPNRLIVSEPPQQRNAAGADEESAFLVEWRRILQVHGVAAEPESLRAAWFHGGEAHCSSNAIRQPIVR